jgi:hypothetical protein
MIPVGETVNMLTPYTGGCTPSGDSVTEVATVQIVDGGAAGWEVSYTVDNTWPYGYAAPTTTPQTGTIPLTATATGYAASFSSPPGTDPSWCQSVPPFLLADSAVSFTVDCSTGVATFQAYCARYETAFACSAYGLGLSCSGGGPPTDCSYSWVVK